MKERPILFSGAMVRALLAGTKTQTRRVFADRDVNGDALHTPPALQSSASREGRWFFCARKSGHIYGVDCPYGKPGDRLWVRETFKQIASGEVKDGYGEVRYGYAYQADSATIWAKHPTIIHDLTGQPPTGPMQFQPRPWKPSIHMPRRASRITLEITEVRVQRLQDISEEDAVAEGAPLKNSPASFLTSHKRGFAELWESINGAGSWDANPWVWALTFRRLKP